MSYGQQQGVADGEDSLETFQNTATLARSPLGRSPSQAQFNTYGSASPTNYGSPTAMMRQSNLSSQLMGQTGGLVPVSGYMVPKPSKGSTSAGSPQNSQLKANMVPNEDALSNFIEAGQVYGLRHTEKDTETHINNTMVPHKEYDAGIGFEGWYSNGQNSYIKPNHQSHIDPHNGGVPLDDAETWQEGWCVGRGGGFSLPVKNNRRASGMQRATSQPLPTRPPVFSIDDVEFKAPNRARAVARTNSLGQPNPEGNQWTTSYDTTFAPMNERANDRIKMKKKTGTKNKANKSQRTFNWRKRAAEKKAGMAGSPQNKPWAGGAKKVDIPRIVC